MKSPQNVNRNWVFIVIAVVTLTYLAAFAVNLTPYLRGPNSWRWAYAIPGIPKQHIVPIVTIGLYTIIVIVWMGRLDNYPKLPTARFLTFVALSIPLIQLALLFAESPDVLRPLFYRTISAGASGVFSVGSTITNLGDFLRWYPQLMPGFPVHPQRYPPGLPILFFIVRRLLEIFPALADAIGLMLRRYQCQDLALMHLSNATIATSVIQMTLPVFMGLIVYPLYSLTKRAFGKKTALWAVVFYPLVPSFALWSGRWDQFYPLLTCTAFAFFWRGLTRCDQSVKGSSSSVTRYLSWPWFFLSGLLISINSFLSFGVIVMLVPMGISALLWLLHNPRCQTWGKLAVDVVAFCAGLVLLWFTYQLTFSVSFLDIWRVSMAFHLGLGREYAVWLYYHLHDFFTFLGLPLALLFALGLIMTIREGWKKHGSTLVIGFSISLALLDLSGTAQGEVARVWLFLTPFAVIIASNGLAVLERKRWHGVLIMALLSVQLLVYNAFLRVVTTGISDPPNYTRGITTSKLTKLAGVRFGDYLELVAYDFEPRDVRSGSPLTVTLSWHSLKPIPQPYTVFVHLMGPGGELVTQHDSMPQEGKAPTTCWIPGEFIPDWHTLSIPAGSKPGEYTLVAGLYLWETGERLSVGGEMATEDGSVIISSVSVHGIEP